MKLGLIGGQFIDSYTLAGHLWERIGRASGIEFSFVVKTLATESSVHDFWEGFVRSEEFVGFNIAAPWKKSFSKFPLIEFQQDSGVDSINVVYKHRDRICANNTDVSSIYRSIIEYGPIDEYDVLVLGAGGVGAPTAKLLAKSGAKKVDVFDIVNYETEIEGASIIKSFYDVGTKNYDVIINATPQGRLFLNKSPVRFSMPISIKTFTRCIKPSSIYVDLNYFPVDTELVSYSRVCNLRIVTGVEILVYQAVESFGYYTGYRFSKNKIDALISQMTRLSESEETVLLRSPI